MNLQNFFKPREMPKTQQKNKQKVGLWICYRNCFGLLYIVVRNTLPKACFLHSILASSLTTAKKETLKSAVNDYLLSVTCPLYQSVRLLNVPYNLVKLETVFMRALINQSRVTANFVPSMDSIPF